MGSEVRYRAGLAKEAIEGPKGPYANLIAVREQDKGKPWVAKLIRAYQSNEVKQFVLNRYKNSVIVAW